MVTKVETEVEALVVTKVETIVETGVVALVVIKLRLKS